MKFLVKWLNYDSNRKSLELWKSMRTTDQLRKYLRDNNISYVIPKEFLNITPVNREEPLMISMKTTPNFFPSISIEF